MVFRFQSGSGLRFRLSREIGSSETSRSGVVGLVPVDGNVADLAAIDLDELFAADKPWVSLALSGGVPGAMSFTRLMS